MGSERENSRIGTRRTAVSLADFGPAVPDDFFRAIVNRLAIRSCRLLHHGVFALQQNSIRFDFI